MVTWQKAIAEAGALSEHGIVAQIHGPKPEQAFVTLAHDRGATLVDSEEWAIVFSDGKRFKL